MTGDRDTDAYRFNQQIARRLKAARATAGISQQRAGDALGVTFQQLQKQERGANRVSAGALAVLAKLYDKPVGWFFQDLNGEIKGRDDIVGFLALPGAAKVAERYSMLCARKDDDGVALVLDLLRRLTEK